MNGMNQKNCDENKIRVNGHRRFTPFHGIAQASLALLI